MANIRDMSEHIAYLILLHLHNNLTPAEGDELDNWVSASDDNLEMFEELIDVY